MTTFKIGTDHFLALGINALLRVYKVGRNACEVAKLAEVESQIIAYKVKVVKDSESDKSV